HVYRGVFGSHVANVLRRLRRAAAIHGSEPRFLLASATIANPTDLAEVLTGLEPFNLVDRDGAPAASRRIALWHPPLPDGELGIDIGELDAAICVTFPGTVASLKQMWGRAGRRGRGLAVYVAGEDALDQFFCRHPSEFINRAVEAAILDPHSPEIFAEHLLCAAHEAPLTDEDAAILGPNLRDYAEQLAEAGL